MTPEMLERTPMLTADGVKLLERMREHPDAPRFNYITGDRLRHDDLGALDFFRQALNSDRGPRTNGPPPPAILQRVVSWRRLVPFIASRVPEGLNLERDWLAIPTSSRSDLALAPWNFVPDNEPLDRLIIYRTAGTTGHPITIPHHPMAIRCYEPLIEFALGRYNAKPEFDGNSAACFLIGAQIRTYTYAAILSAWNGAGFAKLNIRQTEWPHEGSQQRYIAEMAPKFLSGDPISFAEMMHLDVQTQPSALLTTSVAMSPSLKKRLSEKYKAPVIDWYSMVETGPIGYACPHGFGYHLLPHDIHLEVLRDDGTQAAPGERGEIAVTGGRNPFAPLLRYRTGDFGHVDYSPCSCGDPMPRLLDLEGRVPVLIRSSDGTPVSTVDLSRLLREHPLLLHEFIQHADRSCELTLRALPDASPDKEKIESDLRRVLGTVPLEIRFDPTLGDRQDGKALPYRSELMLEE